MSYYISYPLIVINYQKPSFGRGPGWLNELGSWIT
jgi:hypothetical protein